MSVLRVTVHDAWDEVAVPFDPAMSLAEVKRRALEVARVTDAADRFLLKFHGAELRDEARTVAEAGLVVGAPLIVLRRRRRAVR